ncbi:signal transduction histidine kinase [Jannaschia pagri]|uniref:histidine kinase n=1 Tax=Jannaschia pagri TaxID=2829797 RepID=A0ABQ4NIV8_9RHOB|nr:MULTISPECIES: HWE histidine kinase domain-containing protein [unclassified Jannaschia]GIT90521.1 signal transduction histidine kinase [Jannaschia sp. AI_61]GIT94353.1 signal transduction histidine kinase [Jannaschia sp. AI_62]
MLESRSLGTEQRYDITNCDREPIHILGRVQSYGCLIAVSSDWMVTYASENCKDLLGFDAESIIGSRFSEIISHETVHHLRTKMQVLGYQSGAARLFSYAVFGDDRLFDISISQSDQNIIFEFEPRKAEAPATNDSSVVRALVGRVRRHDTVEKMAREAVRAVKVLSGFDRVMVYKFNEDDSGTVIAETTEPGQDSFLGLRYPASDIPKQARGLYLRSPLRIIADITGDTYAIRPEKDPNGRPLDLSLAVTRAVSPVHLEYLRNMGVRASLSVSIIRNGKLWGLFACHHRTPRHISYEVRSEIELFAELFNYQLSQVELTIELEEVDRARSLHDRLMTQLSGGKSMAEAFDVLSESVKEVIPFDGAAVYADGDYQSVGVAPTAEEFMGLARFLNTTPAGQVYQTDALATRYPGAEDFADRVAGVLALPVSRTPRDYLVLFRREIASSVKWAGNPDKPVEVGPNGIRLTPRKSFAAWQQVVRGKSAPWRGAELRAADALRVTLLEVVLKIADERNAMRKRAQDQQELLVAELNHRVRNILNLIRGLVSQGKEDARSIDDYRLVLEDRIFALARAHDQLTQTEWTWSVFRSLVETEVKAFLTAKANRVIVTGDDIELSPTAFSTLALVIHELVTNSAKYGALNDSSGSVRLDVRLQPDGAAKISWRDENGPPVQAPTRRGFGTTIIERSIPFELQGQAEVRYRMTGFEADFVLPSAHVRPTATPISSTPQQQATPHPSEVRLNGHFFVLEDNLVIALDAVDMLTDLGADAVHTASSVVDGLAVLDKQDITLALLDVNLGNETSLPVIQRCQERGIPVVLATGYGANVDILDKFPSVPILNKPYNSDGLRDTISAALARFQATS